MRFRIVIILLQILIFNSTIYSQEKNVSIKEKAFLDVIAHAEGTHEKYNLTFCHKTFDNYENHPNVAVKCSGYTSTASGRYQFLFRTWKYLSKKYGYKDFSPNNQDNAALALIKENKVDIEKINNYQTFSEVIIKLNKIWASFPNSPYGQPVKKMKDLWHIWNKSLKK